MLTVIGNQNIEYTQGDTFELPVTQTYDGEFSSGMCLKLIISKSVIADPFIEKNFDIGDDLSFNIVLDEADKEKLTLGEYLYKIIIHKEDRIVTEKSGFFTVKWGA